jgi:pimeloyl-ACP methyl ester carboxylesterase
MDRGMKFDCATYNADGLLLSYLDSGGDRPVLHLSHANGFPISMYLPLMNELARDFRVIGLNLRGQDGLTEGILNWHRLAFDLIGFLESLGCGPVIGVGHSIGAVTAMFSAARRPDLFSRVVLLDPVLLPRKYVLLIRFMKLFRKKDRFPLAMRARRRRNGWQSREEALSYFRNKELFNEWEDEFLRAYVTYGLRPEPDGRVVLVCPPEAEARGFENYPVDVWSWPKLLETPTLIVRGEKSDALTQKCYQKFCRLCPSAQGVVMQGTGHFVPMQNSAETIQLIKDFCAVSP